MKKSLLTGLILLLASFATAQIPTPIRSVSTLPVTCHGGNASIYTDEVVLITGGVGTTYYCSAPNTWTAFSSGGGSGTINPGTQYQMPVYVSGGTTVGPSAFLSTDAIGNLNVSTDIFSPLLDGAIAFVDGKTYLTAQSVYAANPNWSGKIIIPSTFGSPVNWTTDPYANTATVAVPTVTVTGTSCLTKIPNNMYEEVQLFEADSSGSIVASAPVVSSTKGNGSTCYSVTVPTGAIIGGLQEGFIFAEACLTSPCSPFTPTLQSIGSAEATFTAAGTLANLNSTTSSTGSGVQPIAVDAGLQMIGTDIYLEGVNYVVNAPVVLGNPGLMRGNAVGNGAGGTVVQAGTSLPAPVPVAPAPKGLLVTGGSGTLNNYLTVETAVTWGLTSPYNTVLSISRAQTFGPFTSTLTQVELMQPSPPFLPNPWTPSMTYWIGATVDDENNLNTTGPCLWKLTAISSGSFNYTTAASNFFPSCTSGTPGSTTTTDGIATWTLQMVSKNVAAQAYNAGDEVWDSTHHVFQQAQTAFTSNGSPTYRPLFAAVSTGDNGLWANIGKNVIPHPGIVFYAQSGSSSSGSYSGLAAVESSPVFVNSGCTNFFTAVATCGLGQTQATVFISATGANTAAPSNLTLSATACPQGLTCGNLSATIYYVQMMWGTPLGLTPPFAEATVSGLSNGQGILVTPPSIASAPPEATCYSLGTNDSSAGGSLAEMMEPPDGFNVIAGTGGSSQYLNGLQHGQCIPLGETAVIVNDQPNSQAFGFATLKIPGSPLPTVNTTGNMISLGSVDPLAPSVLLGSNYYSRISDLTLEASPVGLNHAAPYTGLLFNSSAQEQSGPFHVQFNDSGSYDYYAKGPDAQNSSMGDDHDTGIPNDGKECVVIDTVGAFRGVFGGSMCGGTQGAQYSNRNAIHAYTPLWSNFGAMQINMQSVIAEGAVDAFECSNCNLVVLIDALTTSTTGRHVLDLARFDEGTYNWSVDGASAGGAGVCAIRDDTLNDGACLTTVTKIGKCSAGNVADVASAYESLDCPGDPGVPNQFYAGFTVGTTAQFGFSQSGAGLFNGATVTGNSTASFSPFLITGNPVPPGGTGATAYPQLYFNQTGNTPPTSFSTGGTLLGFNLPSGFVGDTIELHFNGGPVIFKVDYQGNTTANTVQSSEYNINGTTTSYVNCPQPNNAICSSALSGTETPLYIGTSGTSITILGATTPLVYYIAGQYQTINTTLTIPNCGSQPCWTTPAGETEIFIFALLDTTNWASIPLADIAITTCPLLISYVPPPNCAAASSTNLQFFFNLGTNQMMACNGAGSCGTFSNFTAKAAILLGVAMVSTTPTVDGVVGMPFNMDPTYIYENFGDGSSGSKVLTSGTTTQDGVFKYSNFSMSNATLQHTQVAGSVNTPGLLVYSQTPVILADAQGASTINVNGLSLAGPTGTAGTCTTSNSAFGRSGSGGGSGGASSTNAGCKGEAHYSWGFQVAGGGGAGTAGSPGTAGQSGQSWNTGWAAGGVDLQPMSLEYYADGFGSPGAAGAGVSAGGTGGNGGTGGGVAVIKTPSINVVSGSTMSANGTVGTIGTTSTTSGGCGGGGGGGTAGYIAGFSVNGVAGITASGAIAVTTCTGLSPESSNGGAGGAGHVVAVRVR
jgi:hypothetical protein